MGTGLLGFAMFVVLFLGTTLAIFLTIGTVRGDAERGLLQPLVVRPRGPHPVPGRPAGRGRRRCRAATWWASSACWSCSPRRWGSGSPTRVLGAGLGLVGAVLVVCLLSLLGSTFLTATANGIAVFMLFGAGLAAALLHQLAHRAWTAER